MIANIPDHPPMYVSTPVLALPAKLAKETIYMPSSVANRLLGALGGLVTLSEQAQQATQATQQPGSFPPRH